MGIIRDQIKIEPCPDGLVLKFNSHFLISACTFVRESSQCPRLKMPFNRMYPDWLRHDDAGSHSFMKLLDY